jgi:2-methylcitrate dehydratase PrpD
VLMPDKIEKLGKLKKLLNVMSKYTLSSDTTFKKNDLEIAEKLIFNARKEITIFKKTSEYKKLKAIFKNTKQDIVFINAYGIHHRDFDEMSYSIGGHPTATILPVLLAFNVKYKKNYFLQALKLEIILGKLFNPELYNTKYHPTTIIGALGSTAISAKILNLSHRQTINAFGITFSFLSGIKGNFGSDAKSLQVASAVEHGLLSALFSNMGFTSNIDLLDKTETLQFFTNKKIKDNAIKNLKKLLSSRLSLKNEFLFKKYDVCGSFHEIINLALKDRKRLSGRLLDIKEVILRINPERLRDKNILLPKSAVEKKFSPQYLYAYTFLGNNIKQITTSKDISKDVLKFMGKVKVIPDVKMRKWQYKTIQK